MNGLPTSNQVIFEATGGDNLFCKIQTNGQSFCQFGSASAYGTAVSASGWVDIGYSWDYTGTNHSAYTSAGAAWEEDAGELGAAGLDITTLKLGEDGLGDPGNTNSIYIDKIAIVTGYEADAPWW